MARCNCPQYCYRCSNGKCDCTCPNGPHETREAARRATPSDGDGVRVPREPTPEILRAINGLPPNDDGMGARDIYLAIVAAAAPTAKEPSNG